LERRGLSERIKFHRPPRRELSEQKAKIAMASLAYNLTRLAWLTTRTAPA
jgi:hypothetical protein